MWESWASYLTVHDIQALKQSGKVKVFDGDITSINFGLHEDQLEQIRRDVSVVIHAASTINLQKRLEKVGPIIIQPSINLAKMALRCPNLIKFVYISTAFAGAFLRETPDRRVIGSDALVKEDINDIRCTKLLASTELHDLETYGTTPEYSFVRHPFAYSYAKHLTERLLKELFQEQKHKLLIFRPSCIGPAESWPYPSFEKPGSCPVTSFLAGVIANPPFTLRASSHLKDPWTASINEIPVDIVTHRLVVHVARGTTGIVHAVARRDDHISIATVWKHAAKLRRFWWGMPKLKWNTEHWKSPEQSALARLYVVMGCSFTFEEGQTTVAWNHMSSAEREAWPLWGKEGDSATERLDRRNEALVAMVDKLLSKYSKTTFLKAKIVMDI